MGSVSGSNLVRITSCVGVLGVGIGEAGSVGLESPLFNNGRATAIFKSNQTVLNRIYETQKCKLGLGKGLVLNGHTFDGFAEGSDGILMLHQFGHVATHPDFPADERGLSVELPPKYCGGGVVVLADGGVGVF